jgi:hypothetical protein
MVMGPRRLLLYARLVLGAMRAISAQRVSTNTPSSNSDSGMNEIPSSTKTWRNRAARSIELRFFGNLAKDLGVCQNPKVSP